MAKNLPVGTFIVTNIDIKTPKGLIKRGSVGTVHEHLPGQVFLVRMPDDRLIEFHEDVIDCQRDSFKSKHIRTDLVLEDIQKFIECEFITGSMAYGMNSETSDEDVVGVFMLPPDYFHGLREYRDTVVSTLPDQQHHEIKKLIALACNGNPNVMELGAIAKMPHLLKKAPTNAKVKELIERWDSLFMSKYVFGSYQKYANSQFKKLEQDLRNHGEIRWKHASHLLRLIWAGTMCMRIGSIVIRPKDYDEKMHDFLMVVKRGEITPDELTKHRLQFEKDFQTEFDRCKLPDEADFIGADAILREIRSSLYTTRFVNIDTARMTEDDKQSFIEFMKQR